jgi:hypothetical protein
VLPSTKLAMEAGDIALEARLGSTFLRRALGFADEYPSVELLEDPATTWTSLRSSHQVTELAPVQLLSSISGPQFDLASPFRSLLALDLVSYSTLKRMTVQDGAVSSKGRWTSSQPPRTELSAPNPSPEGLDFASDPPLFLLLPSLSLRCDEPIGICRIPSPGSSTRPSARGSRRWSEAPRLTALSRRMALFRPTRRRRGFVEIQSDEGNTSHDYDNDMKGYIA